MSDHPPAADNNVILQLYEHTIFDQNITTLITNSSHLLDFWIPSIRAGPCIVGLGIELVDDDDDEVATIQFCIGHRCLIYHLYSALDDSRCLEPFLGDTNFIFVGFGLQSKLEALGLYVRHVDLHNLSHLIEAVRGPASSDLTVLVRHALQNVDGVWPRPCGRTWDMLLLSPEQARYASAHAYMAYQMAWLLKFGKIPEKFSIRLVMVEPWATEHVHEVRFSGQRITTTVTNRITAVENWIANVTHGERRRRIVGFDVETCMFNGRPHVATVQLCVEKSCLIIQFFRMHGRHHYFPNLERFLLRDSITFVGVNIMGKMKLFTDWLLFPRRGHVKMLDLAARTSWELHMPELAGEAEPLALVRHMFGADVRRPPRLESGWDMPALSYVQVEWACMNAAASFEIGRWLL